jgi:hypothetical protein
MTTMKTMVIATAATLVVGSIAAFASGPEDGEETTTIPAGTTFIAALQENLSSTITRPDDEFELRTVRSVRINDRMDIPAGSLITGEVTDNDEGLGVRFTELVIEGDDQEIDISTDQFRFGTLNGATTRHTVVPAGWQIAIRLNRPVTVEYRPGETHIAE